MALFKALRGNRSSLDAQSLHDGYAYFCTDDGSFWIDYTDADGNLQRKQINKADLEALGYKIDSIPQADYNQNDTTAKDYILNRTHWMDDPVTNTWVALEETTFETYDGGSGEIFGTSFNLVDGAECVVTLDGVEYTTICEKEVVDGMEALYLGNPVFILENAADNGQPFGIAYLPMYYGAIVMTFDTESSSHTVQIMSTVTTQEIHKLDNKYIDAEWMAKPPIGERRIEFLPETTLSEGQQHSDAISMYQLNNIDGFAANGYSKAYVAIDGIEYTCTVAGEVCNSEGGGETSIALGNISAVLTDSFETGDPYAIQINTNYLLLLVPTGGEHTLKIEFAIPVYEQLPKHYIEDALSSVKLTLDDTPTSGSNNPVTSSGVYNALSGKQATITGAASTIATSNITPNMVLVSDDFGKVAPSTITSTELDYLDGVTSNIQEQISNNSNAAFLSMSGALKWDGVIGDRDYVGESDDSSIFCYVHVSDEYPQILLDMLNSGQTTLYGSVGIVTDNNVLAVPIDIEIQTDGFAMLDGAIIVPTDNYDVEGLVFPKKGIYFMSMNLLPSGFDFSVTYTNALFIAGHSFTQQNQYFEMQTKVSSIGDTLTWDGNTDGLVKATLINQIDNSPINFYKISDNVITPNDVVNGIKYINPFSGEIIERNGEEAQTLFNEDGLIDVLVWCNIPTDNYVYNVLATGTYPEAGIYVMDGYAQSFLLTVNGYNFTTTSTQEVIKTDHLPEALRFGEIATTTYIDTLTWDGNTDGKECLEGALYKISDVIPTLEDLKQGVSVAFQSGGISDTYTLSAEELEALNNDEGVINISGLCCIIPQPLDEYSAGVYFLSTDSSFITSLTISNYTGFVTTTTELVKIDPKYLPDDIGGGSGLPTVTTADNGKSVSVVNGAWEVKKLSYNDISDKPELFSGSYNDLDDKPLLFSNIKVGSTTIAADTTTDTLTIAAGSNITITPDATNDKITIAATDTTYSEATTTQAGLMSAADKIKLDGLSESGGSVEGVVTEEMLFETIPGSDTVTWDGSFDGLESTGGLSFSISQNLYKVSDITAEAFEAIGNMEYSTETLQLTYAMTYDDPDMDDYTTQIDLLSGFMLGEGAKVTNNGSYIEIYINSWGNMYDGYIIINRDGIWYSDNTSGSTGGLGMGAGRYCISKLSFAGVSLTEGKKVIKSDLLQIDISEINTVTDTEMSNTSENPVQNKVIKAYVDSMNKTYTAGNGITLSGTKFSNTAPLYYVTSLTVKDIGSSTSGSYLATKWAVSNIDGITVPTDGMTIALRVPGAGTSGGILLSINNGVTYYPIMRNVNTLVTTHYSAGASLILTFNSAQTAEVYTAAGTKSTVTGCWQIADYDSDTKTRSSNKTGTKMYLIGAQSQSTSGQTTYSNSNCYIGTDNCLYSGGKKVATSDTTYSEATTTTSGLMSAADKIKLNDAVVREELFTIRDSDTVTWDGNTSGLESYSGWYRIADISDEVVEAMCIAANNGSLTGSITDENGVQTAISVLSVENGFVAVQKPQSTYVVIFLTNTTAANEGYPNGGIYTIVSSGYVSSITIDGFVISKKQVINSDLLQVDLDSITADTEMSDTSTNPVQNKVIKAYVDSAIEAAIGAAISASY